MRVGFLKMGVVLVVCAVAAVGYVSWRKQPLPAAWADLRSGEGYVLSLASGTAQDGSPVLIAAGYHRSDATGHDLRVVCYNEADGKVRWERQMSRSLPNMSKVPHVEVDQTGNVLVGWDYWAVGAGSHTVVEKLSGTDGQTVWEWKAKASGGQSGHLAVPKPDALERVWAAGIQQVGPDHYRRFLALAKQSDGSTIWEHQINDAEDANDRRLRVSPLASGDAMLLAPPRGGERSFPWLMQRISASDGKASWSREFLRENERGLPSVEWLIDEANQQVLAFSYSVTSGRAELAVLSLELSSGTQKWARTYRATDLPEWGITSPRAGGRSGEIEGYSRRLWETRRFKWWRWRKEDNFWFPEIVITRHEQPERIFLSATDGRILRREPFGSDSERLNEVVASPDGVSVILFLRSINPEAEGRWRVVREAGHVSLNKALGREIAGYRSQLRFPRFAHLSKSGRVVIAGNLEGEEVREWHVRLW